MITVHHDLLLNAVHEAGIDTSEVEWNFDNGDRPRRPMFAISAADGPKALARFFSVLGMMAVGEYSSDVMTIDVNTVMQIAEGVTPDRGHLRTVFYFPNITVIGTPESGLL